MYDCAAEQGPVRRRILLFMASLQVSQGRGVKECEMEDLLHILAWSPSQAGHEQAPRRPKGLELFSRFATCWM